jgi:hypothetical protein
VARHRALKAKVKELAERDWNIPGIEDKFRQLASVGIPKKILNRNELIANKKKILTRVQQRAEEYEYLSHSCAKGSALAVMEEFGLGNMEIIKALSAFPGLGMTGWTCGAVTGGLIALSLYFGSNEMLDYDATGRTMAAARKFLPRRCNLRPIHGSQSQPGKF